MMITDGGTIVQLRMNEISILKRITSGVKMIDLDEGVKVAKIAKVREKISDGEQEYDDIDDALQSIPEESGFEADAEPEQDVNIDNTVSEQEPEEI